MAQFMIRCFDPGTGGVSTQQIAAASREEAEREATAQGGVVLEVREAGWQRFTRHRKTDIGLFCEELATLLGAGLGLVEALDALAHRGHSADSELHRSLLEALQRGQPLSQVMAARSDVFPPLLVASLRSAERTGQLAESLHKFARMLRGLQDVRRKLLSAMIYPSLVIAFGGLVGMFLLFFIIPRFASVYSGLGTKPGFVSMLLTGLSQHMAHYRNVWLLVLLAALAGLIQGWRSGRLPRLIMETLVRIGWVRYWFRLFQMAEVYRSLGMLLRGGFTVLEAMELCGQTPAEPIVRERLRQVALRVGEGMPFSQSLQEAEIADAIALRLIVAGERSGELPAVLDAIADDHNRRLERQLERAMKLAEPLIMIVVGGFIGALVLLMYMPIFDLAGTLTLP